MKVQAIQAWFNFTVKIQRRPAQPPVNALGEPMYGDSSTWPIFPDPLGNQTHKCRIEYNSKNMVFGPTGERVMEGKTLMFLRSDDFVEAEDRVTILNTNVNPNITTYFIVQSTWPESDAVGNVSHYVAELQNP